MLCSNCLKEPELDSAGYFIRPVVFVRGKKSGMPTPEEDLFPDAKEEKYICFECASSPEPLAAQLGPEQGYDFDMRLVQTPHNTGTEI